MADAFKNGGIVLAPILTVFLGFVCAHTQHQLVNSSEAMRERYKLKELPDYAETLELCIDSGPERIKKWSKISKSICNGFIGFTQLGFCCVYFLFVSSNIKQVLESYGIFLESSVLMTAVLVPILLISLITNLKYLAPCSAIANVSILSGIGIVFYYSSMDLPSPAIRTQVGNIDNIPLFFGTAVFAFEAIGLVGCSLDFKRLTLRISITFRFFL